METLGIGIDERESRLLVEKLGAGVQHHARREPRPHFDHALRFEVTHERIEDDGVAVAEESILKMVASATRRLIGKRDVLVVCDELSKQLELRFVIQIDAGTGSNPVVEQLALAELDFLRVGKRRVKMAGWICGGER